MTIPLTLLCVAYGVEPLLSSGLSHFTGTELAIALCGLLVFSAMLIHVVWRGTRATERKGKPWSLIGVGYLAVAMYFGFGPAVVALPALFGGTAAFLLSRRRAPAAVLVTVASIYLALSRQNLPVSQVLDLMGRAVIVMSVIYGVGKVLLLGQEVERNRTELARLAVVEERLRFSRDLHDVLGHSLSVIALKGEVAAKLTARDPHVAVQEMNAIVEIARGSVADIRSLVRGYRRPSLGAEVAGAKSVLEAAGVHCTVNDVAIDDLPDRVREVFGWVIREGVTNVLRHSDATRCAITFLVSNGRLVLDVVNDGVDGRQRSAEKRAGHGLEGLTERLAGIEGDLTGERLPNGTFRLRASAPVRNDGKLPPTGKPASQSTETEE